MLIDFVKSCSKRPELFAAFLLLAEVSGGLRHIPYCDNSTMKYLNLGGVLSVLQTPVSASVVSGGELSYS
jgi:hypothetical protein